MRLQPATLATLLLASPFAIAQQPADKKVNPVTLVSRAEALIKKGEKEDAALMLWQALDLLRGREPHPIEDMTRLSARFLLKENDPFEMERRAAFTEVAKLQVAVGKSYRIKKWYDTARGRLDVAALYDPHAIGKERTVLEAKAKGKKGAPKKAAPKPAAKKKVDNLDRTFAVKVGGSWRNVDGELESKQHKGDNEAEPRHWHWTTEHHQDQHQVSFEFRSLDPNGEYNFGLGLGVDPAKKVGGYRLILQHFKNHKVANLRILKVDGMTLTEVAAGFAELGKTANGYHLVTATVREDSVSFQIDANKPTVAKNIAPPSGIVALMVGIQGVTSSAIRYRNLTIGPLPADAPTDEELRQQELEKRQHAITDAVEKANELIAARKKEPAALLLRGALLELRQMPAGVLRDNLAKPIDEMLKKADPTAKKRHTAALKCAEALGVLAEKYAADKRPRLGLVLAQRAMQFDPDGQAARLKKVEKAIADWNVAQLTVRTAELAAPKDDGKMLREWFAGGTLLDSRAKPWIVEGAGARIEKASDGCSMLMPKQGTLLEGTFGVHVRLPANATQGGVVFDAAGPHDFAVAMVIRTRKELILHVTRWAGGKWLKLATKKVPTDAWRLEAWHPITVETAKSGIKVKALGVEVKLDRKRLGDANGRIGLYAANLTNDEATIEVRAFHAKPK